MLYLFILLTSVIFLDICLSGDNAVVIAMAANTLPETQRSAAIYAGMVFAALLRIILALMATVLLQMHWIAPIGGLALLYIAYSLFKDMTTKTSEEASKVSSAATLRKAILVIIGADLSMSVDNVLAVAGMARGHPIIMSIGIFLSIAMLAVATQWIAPLMKKWPLLNWVGLALIVYVALDLIFSFHDIHFMMYQGGVGI